MLNGHHSVSYRHSNILQKEKKHFNVTKLNKDTLMKGLDHYKYLGNFDVYF